MGPFTKGEVVLFPFPFTDLSERKLRPCLVISDEMENDLILCQITSKFSQKDNLVVELKKNDSIGGSLMLDSYIRCNMVFTASKDQITRVLCSIPKQKYSKVVEKITSIIA
ncbi:MAG: type II toxin-antitoxin system PemK/MazF family toxin [Nanoarchaeota archaeon]|jgi:mRNA interferase MazF|nr:type II toxin-antitoxin system PemK/MazF family toxin [Nanoarchaeota archaeon]